MNRLSRPQKLRNYALVLIGMGFVSALGLDAATGNVPYQLGLVAAALVGIGSGGAFWAWASRVEARVPNQQNGSA